MAKPPQEKTRILIADDHPPFAYGLSKLLTEQPDMEPVGIASDGEEAVKLANELKPDVVVMDISMPKVNGIEATREIVEHLEGTYVIGLSLHDEADLGQVIRDAGAVTYLQKDAASTGLIRAIREHCDPESSKEVGSGPEGET